MAYLNLFGVLLTPTLLGAVRKNLHRYLRKVASGDSSPSCLLCRSDVLLDRCITAFVFPADFEAGCVHRCGLHGELPTVDITRVCLRPHLQKHVHIGIESQQLGGRFLVEVLKDEIERKGRFLDPRFDSEQGSTETATLQVRTVYACNNQPP